MPRRIYITGIPKTELDIGLYVHTLITLARELDEQGLRQQAEPKARKPARREREATDG